MDSGKQSGSANVLRGVRLARADEGDRLVQIWRRAVDATHDFLSPEDRVAIDAKVRAFLPHASAWVVVDGTDRPVAFMLLDGTHMEALFVDLDWRGQGAGATLVRHGLALNPVMTTDVNAANGQAIGFYALMGFEEIGRSPLDGQGRPYR